MIASSTPHVVLDGVGKTFGDFVAVRDVDLAIQHGELFSLLGGSGCGKTTLLRMLAGLTAPSSGRISIGGADVTHLPPYERPVNMMFQSYALFPHMSVESNVGFGLRREGVAGREVARRVGEALELVQMTGFARRRPAQLSGGQKQRVALARAIVKRPKVLLLDEPLSALDKKLRDATQFELTAIQQQVGITFVMVTHDQQEAMAMSTRIAVMDGGRIVQVGRPDEIYEAPRSRFVADFVGLVNLFDAVVVTADRNGAVLRCAASQSDFVVTAAVTPTPGEAACLALRPERIEMLPDGGVTELVNRMSGRIQDVAYLGGSCLYQVVLAGGVVVKVSRPNFAQGSGVFVRGQAVTLSWPADAGVLIDL